MVHGWRMERPDFCKVPVLVISFRHEPFHIMGDRGLGSGGSRLIQGFIAINAYTVQDARRRGGLEYCYVLLQPAVSPKPPCRAR